MGFEEDSPQASEWLSNIEIDLQTLTSLESALLVDYTGDGYAEGMRSWPARS